MLCFGNKTDFTDIPCEPSIAESVIADIKKTAAGVPSVETFRHRRRRFAIWEVFLTF
jgi:hypothetical protein